MAKKKPEKFKLDIRLPVSVDAVVVVLLLLTHLLVLRFTHFTDWPETLVYPWLLGHGFVPYRDLGMMYPPLGLVFLREVYDLIGYSPDSQRLVAWFLALSSDALIYAIACRIFGKRVLAGGIVLFFITWHTLFEANTLWYESMLLPLFLLGYLSVREYLVSGRAVFPAAAGLILALAVLIKQTALIPATATAVFLFFYRSAASEKKQPAYYFSAPFLSVIGLFWLWLAVNGLAGAGFSWLVGLVVKLPGTGSGFTLPVPLPDLKYIAGGFLPLACLVFIRKNIRNSQLNNEIYFLIITATAVFLSGMSRWSLHKVFPVTAFSALAIGYFLKLANCKGGPRKKIMLILIVLSAYNLLLFTSIRKFVFVRHDVQNHFFGTRYETLGKLVAESVGKSDYFVYGDLDYIYFFTDTTPPVKPYVPLFPWHWDIPGVQENIIGSLKEGKIPYVIEIPYHPDTPFYAGKKPENLDRYIRLHYFPFLDIPGGGRILSRRQ